MKRLGVVLAVVVLAAGCGKAPKPPTAAEVLAKMKAAYAGMKSLEMDYEATGTGNASRGTGRVAIERAVIDGKTIEKACLFDRWTFRNAQGIETRREYHAVLDGTFAWDERRRSEDAETRVLKLNPEDPRAFSPTMLVREFEYAVDSLKMKVVGEDEINGRKTWVLQGQQAPTATLPEWSAKFWVGKEDGFVARCAMRLKLATMRAPIEKTMDYFGLKLNQSVEAKLFAYTPPEGANIKDQTGLRIEPRKEPWRIAWPGVTWVKLRVRLTGQWLPEIAGEVRFENDTVTEEEFRGFLKALWERAGDVFESCSVLARNSKDACVFEGRIGKGGQVAVLTPDDQPPPGPKVEDKTKP